MHGRRRADEVDTDAVLAMAEAQLARAGRPRPAGAALPSDFAHLRTIALALVFLVGFVLVTLPQLHLGGYKEQVKTAEDELPTGPVFGHGCGAGRYHRAGRHISSPWPLQGERHVRAAWIAKLVTGSDAQYMHMPMLETTQNGTLVVAYQASSGVEGSSDQHIRIAFARDLSGMTWGPSQPLPFSSSAAQWGPVLHRDSKGRIWVFYSEGVNCKWGTASEGSDAAERWFPGGAVKVAMWTPRHGGTWKEPRTIYPQTLDGGVPKVLANKLLVLSSGEWALPFWSEKHSGTCVFSEDAQGTAGLLVSADEGWSWQRRGTISSAQTWLIENSLVQLKSGALLMYFRTLKGAIYQAKSSDQGYTWSLPEATILANPDSKLHLARLNDGMLALAFNNHPRLKRPYRRTRTNLDVSVSMNEGKSWTRLARLEDAEQPGLRNHYPTMHQVGCTLYVAYARFFHEEYGYEGTNTTLDLGLRLMALNLR